MCSVQCTPLHTTAPLPPGFQASCVPRMGDSSASAQLHGMAGRQGTDTRGFSNLWRGTPDIGCARVVDLGYVHEDRNVLASARLNGNPTVREACQQVNVSAG